jgi:PAS domain S-box-containing protein
MKKLAGAFRTTAPERDFFRGAKLMAAEDDSFQTVTEVCGALLLGMSVMVLVDWITPFFPVLRPAWKMWMMTPHVAACFSALGAVLLYYSRHPFLARAKATVVVVAAGVALWVAVDPLLWLLVRAGAPLPAVLRALEWGEFLAEVSPFTTVSLFLQAVSLALYPSLLRRHRRVGDWVGGVNLLVLILNMLFMLNFFYGGEPVSGEGALTTPGFAAVCGTTLLGVAMTARLGPGYFPVRPFVGPSIDAVLLRKIMPVAITAILISSLLGNSLPSSLDKTVSSYVALLLSALIMIAVVLRASGVIGGTLEETLRESERLYAGLVGSLEDTGVVLLDSQGRVILWNKGAERVTGYTVSEVSGERVASLFPADGIDVEKVLRDSTVGGVAQSQGWTERKDGASFWVEAVVSSIPGKDGLLAGYSFVIRDLTGKKKAEDELRSSLREKEVMLKEIHHRVKNNLQVISSLLRMQSEKAGDKAALELFLDSQHRVRAMSMVHEYLYQSQDLGRIDFSNYVHQLVQSLTRAYGPASGAQPPEVQVESLTMDLDTAVPCGLILTELVSNALKYAYPKGAGGPIFVGFRVLPDGRYELMVADQGTGLPAGFDWRESETLGLRLVHLLVKQLGGEARLEDGAGTKFVITFKGLRGETAKTGRQGA